MYALLVLVIAMVHVPPFAILVVLVVPVVLVVLVILVTPIVMVGVYRLAMVIIAILFTVVEVDL